MKGRKWGKRICIALICVFSLAMVGDVVNFIVAPVSAVGMADMSNVAGMAEFDSADFDGTDFDGESFAGDMPDMDGEMPDMDGDAASDDAAVPGAETDESGMTDRPDVDLSDLTGATTQTSGLRSLLRRCWIGILVVCALGDAVCILLLVRMRRKEKRAAAETASENEIVAVAEAETGAVAAAGASPGKSGPARHRRPGKGWIAPVAVLLVLALVIAMLPSGSTASTMTVEEEVVAGTVETGTIATSINATGTLTEEGSVAQTVPEGVGIEAYYVENGDTVAEGDALARVSLTDVGLLLAEVQSMLDALDEALAEAAESSDSDVLTATASGRVKAIYASEGTSLADTMYESGALMLISLDGLMAADVTAQDDTTVGASVTVTLSDGTEVTGKVSAVKDGVATVTLDDADADLDETVIITDADGNSLGSATLYINSELKVTGYAGTVESVSVSVGDEVSAGDALLTLTDAGDSAEHISLLSQRQELEEQMACLARLALDGTVYADTAGIVSGIDEDAAYESLDGEDTADAAESAETSDDADEESADGLSAGTGGFVLTLLTAGTSDGESAAEGTSTGMESATYYLAQVIYLKEDLVTVLFDPTAVETDGEDLAALAEDLDTSQMSTGKSFALTDLEGLIYGYDEAGELVELEVSELQVGDVLVLVCSDSDVDAPTMVVDLGAVAETDDTEGSDEGDTTGEETSDQTAGIEDQTENTEGLDQLEGDADQSVDGADVSQEQTWDTVTGTDITGTTGTMEEAQATDAISTEEESTSTYSLGDTTVLSVAPTEHMTLTIDIDELDVLDVQVGQTAEITLNALSGRSFTGTVTSLSTTGTNSGGSTKYTAEVELDRTEEMLAGMNASVRITIEETADVLVVPAAALVEVGATTYVYTAYDEKSDTLDGLVEVETGVSDGESVEILSGLEDGDSYYYRYAGTISYS